MTRWIPACAADDVDREDVVPFAAEGREYAIVRSPDDTFHATDGYCTHERERLCDGLVLGTTIECPKHNGRFDYTTGAALGAPVLTGVRTYPTRVQDGTVFVGVDR